MRLTLALSTTRPPQALDELLKSRALSAASSSSSPPKRYQLSGRSELPPPGRGAGLSSSLSSSLMAAELGHAASTMHGLLPTTAADFLAGRLNSVTSLGGGGGGGGGRGAPRSSAARTRRKSYGPGSFVRELGAVDAEIDAFVTAHMVVYHAPEAATVMQSAWRMRGPRLLFVRYMELRTRCRRRVLLAFFRPWASLTLARQRRDRQVLRTYWAAWRQMVQLKDVYYGKLAARLQNTLKNTDAPSCSLMWVLCNDPSEGTSGGGGSMRISAANISIGSVMRNILKRRMPLRIQQLTLRAWHEFTRAMLERRQQTLLDTERMRRDRSRNVLSTCFRFWFRYATTKIADRLGITPPLFRPKEPAFDAWLLGHQHKAEMRVKLEQFRTVRRLQLPFRYWLLFARRNKRLREAWANASSYLVVELMQRGLEAFARNRHLNKERKRILSSFFGAWLERARFTSRVRNIDKKIRSNRRLRLMAGAFGALRRNAHVYRLLNTATTLKIMNRKPVAAKAMYAWSSVANADNLDFFWFIECWWRWRSLSQGRVQFRAFIASHLLNLQSPELEKAWKAWRRYTQARIARRQELAAQGLDASDGIVIGGTPLSTSRATPHGADASKLNTARSGRSVKATPRATARSQQLGVGSKNPTPRLGGGGAADKEKHHWRDDDLGTIFVSLADAPGPQPWRPLRGYNEVMAAPPRWDYTGGDELQREDLARRATELGNVSGEYENRKGETRAFSLVFHQAQPREDLLQMVTSTSPISYTWRTWRVRDAWIWQRVVGFVASNRPPPTSWRNLVDVTQLPLAEKAAAVASRVGTAIERHYSRLVDRLVVQSRDTLLSAAEQDTMLMHRLVEAELLLEAVVHNMFNIGAAVSPMLYQALEAHLRPNHDPAAAAAAAGTVTAAADGGGLLRGDMLSLLLRNFIAQEVALSAAVKTYRENRVKVRRTGEGEGKMSRARKARALLIGAARRSAKTETARDAP